MASPEANKRWREANKEKVRLYKQQQRQDPEYLAREKARQHARYRDDEKRSRQYILKALKAARARAAKAGVPFSLVPDDVVFTGFCALTGIKFSLHGHGGKPSPYSPSLDRVRAEEGYVPGNIRLVLYSVNAFKGSGTDEDVTIIASALLRRQGSEGCVCGASVVSCSQGDDDAT